MRNKLGDKLCLYHIRDAILQIEEYITNLDFEGFSSSSIIKDAVDKQLTIIGEAADHITDELKDEFPEIKWYEVKALRNILVHEYFRVDEHILWNTIHNDIPV